MVLLAFYILSYVADDYLSPSLEKIASTFKMSESLAGVTLMAFGAGAPDVFASISASEGGEIEGIVMGISVLLGSSLFILSVVASLVILSSPSDIKLNWQFFLRDAFFLFCSLLLMLFSMLHYERINMTMSLSFLGLYTLYVVIVFLQDRRHENNTDSAKKAQKLVEMTELMEIKSFGETPKSTANDYDFESEFNSQ
jgi:solute carrier family 24 (sodium/potassium/calcium exchanger), member 6